MDYNAANLAQQQGLSYQDFAVQAAQAYGVPTDLFVKQIGQESGFNPNAQNGNATGIAQIMPGTAADLGVDPNNPYQSIQAAAYYDNQLYQKSHSWAQVMQAYGTTANGAGSSVAALASQIDAAQNSSSHGASGTWDSPDVPWYKDPLGIKTATSSAADYINRGSFVILGIVLIAFALWTQTNVKQFVLTKGT